MFGFRISKPISPIAHQSIRPPHRPLPLNEKDSLPYGTKDTITRRRFANHTLALVSIVEGNYLELGWMTIATKTHATNPNIPIRIVLLHGLRK